MMRDVWGRPIGYRSPSPSDLRRAPMRPREPEPPPRWVEPARRPFGARSPEPATRAEREPEPSVPEPRSAEAPVSAPAPAAAAPPAQGEHVAEARAHLVAAQEELEASRARLAREATREREAERLRLVGEVLPVLDDLDRSIAAAQADEDVKPALVEGFALVRARLERVLEGYGLERILSVGEKFDPAVHQAIALVEVDDEAKQGTVVDEVARGYRAGGRVFRAAMVRVGSAA